jgi:cysteine desulfurase
MLRTVYFDNIANTPVDDRVIAAMLSHLKNTFANPLNIHDFGSKTAAAIEEARAKVASLISADPSEIIFTSCGSESNNMAIKGLAKANEKKGKHIITSAIEHFSVLYCFQALEKEGYKVTYLPVDKFGMVDPAVVSNAMTPETTLVSIIHASNEIGTIQPIKEIAKIVKSKGAIFHTDAVQTAGTIPVNVKELGVDSMTLAANQFYGPTGSAALYVKKGTRIVPLMVGGTQEDGRRPGSHNIPGIVGMGFAAELALKEMDVRNAKLLQLRKRLADGLAKIEKLTLTGHPSMRLPGHVSCLIKFIEGESISLFLNMEGIAVSTGSACASKALKGSHVLVAIGVDPEDVNGSLVVSMSKDSTEQDVDYVLEKLLPIIERLRAMSPMR